MGLVTIGSVVPFAAALQFVAAVPMGLLAQRFRLRATMAATVAATGVTFVAAGLFSSTAVITAAVIGGIIGTVRRRGGGLLAVLGLAVTAGAGFAALSVGSLLLFGRSRALLFANVRNFAGGVANLAARQPRLAPLGHSVLADTELLLRWWWALVGGAVIAGVLGAAVFSWIVLGAVLDRLQDLPGRQDRLAAPPDDRPVGPLPVVLQDVSFRYPGAVNDSLSGINLTVRVGDFLAIVGHNGSGKSTLTRILAGLPPTGGTVQRPGSAGLGLPGGTALVLQRPESQTLGVLVADDVVWGLPPHEAASVDVEALLRQVGLAGLGRAETTNLSGGQQQRLAVAAALARRPALLIADEATSMIDPDGRRELLALLERLPHGGGPHPMAVVLVTHQQADAEAAAAVLHLADGRQVDRPPTWPRPTVPARERPPAARPPLLELRGVNHTYHRGTPWEAPALHDIDLVVGRGEALLVVGGNGSGKSTLAWIMAGLVVPSAGRCLLYDSGRTYPVHQRIGAVELAFQHSRLQLQRQTVGAEIAAWDPGAGSGAVGRALDAVGLNRALASHSIEELSGGQAKRVVMAGIVASRPQLLVLDEPLAGLDPRGRTEIVELLARLHKSGSSLIVISHDVQDLAGMCDRVLSLRSGHLDEQPIPAGLASQPALPLGQTLGGAR